MSSKKKARHFHAGKLRKYVDGILFISISEMRDKILVSRDGRVLTPRHQNGTYLGRDNGHGYMMVGSTHGKVGHAYVHDLVYSVFVGQIPDGEEIDHINQVRNDNRVENLRSLPAVENRIRPCTLAKRVRAVGVSVRNVETGETFDTMSSAARKYNVSRKNISYAAASADRTSAGFHWRKEG